MKLPDVNVLLYAVDQEARQHSTARDWLETALSGREATGFAWSVLLGFVRLATQPAIYPNPLSTHDALDYVAGWLAQPFATVLSPGPEHFAVLSDLLTSAGTAGNLVTDAHLAALAIEHGATLVSYDADFHHFEGLRFEFLG